MKDTLISSGSSINKSLQLVFETEEISGNPVSFYLIPTSAVFFRTIILFQYDIQFILNVY